MSSAPANKQDFLELSGCIGKDMHQIKNDMATLCENQHALLEEIKTLRDQLAPRLKNIGEK